MAGTASSSVFHPIRKRADRRAQTSPPISRTAERLLAAGGLWNTMVMAARVKTLWEMRSRQTASSKYPPGLNPHPTLR
jgi:hypothetical protein